MSLCWASSSWMCMSGMTLAGCTFPYSRPVALPLGVAGQVCRAGGGEQSLVLRVQQMLRRRGRCRWL